MAQEDAGLLQFRDAGQGVCEKGSVVGALKRVGVNRPVADISAPALIPLSTLSRRAFFCGRLFIMVCLLWPEMSVRTRRMVPAVRDIHSERDHHCKEICETKKLSRGKMQNSVKEQNIIEHCTFWKEKVVSNEE